MRAVVIQWYNKLDHDGGLYQPIEWRRVMICKCGNGDPSKFRKQGRDPKGKQKRECKICGKTTTDNSDSPIPPHPAKAADYDYAFTDHGENAEVDFKTRKRIVTERDLIRLLDIDLKVWQIEKFVVGKSEGYRKDRQVDWHVVDGKVERGDVHDTGDLLIKPLFSVKVWLKRKTQEIRQRLALADLKRDLQKFAYRYKKLRYPKLREGMLFEIEMPDIHLGKMTWEEESGENSDLKTQQRRVLDAMTHLLAHAQKYPVERIVLPIGSDYFNVDSQRNETTGGTVQQEDTRWRKTFRAGYRLTVQMIDLCAAVAPVEVLIVPGNHDQERSYYLGCVLAGWYRNCPNVQVNNSAKARKYFLFGVNLIGFAHGHSEKIDDLPALMPGEVPALWARSRFREWHVGHLHHKKEMIYKTTEERNVTVRFLRSLTPVDAWHYDKGFVSAVQASEAFLWHKRDGLIAQFTYTAEPNKD